MKQIIQLFVVFFKIGLLSIGGGYAVIPLIQKEVVERLGWVSKGVFTDIITISQMTPGPLAVNTSTFVGIQIAGISGAVSATVGCVLAGIVISLLLYCFFTRHKGSAYIYETLRGLKASSLGLIISAAVTILLSAFTMENGRGGNMSVDFIAAGIFVCALMAVRKWKLNPILMLVLAGIIGGVAYIG